MAAVVAAVVSVMVSIEYGNNNPNVRTTDAVPTHAG